MDFHLPNDFDDHSKSPRLKVRFAASNPVDAGALFLTSVTGQCKYK